VNQERVADYPRPPRLERFQQRIRIVFGGETIADTTAAFRVLETTHPPTYYLPPDAFIAGALTPSARTSFCEWKGRAGYYNVHGGGRTARDAAWYYPDPTPAFAAMRDHVAVYAGPMDACFVGDEQVTPQPGGFYGGWITGNLIGPFKGARGTEFW
jgi:uncharacterized protein (DUF427 family)